MYKITDLKGNFLFSVEKMHHTDSGSPVDSEVYCFVGANGNVREIKEENRYFSLSNDRLTAKILEEVSPEFLTEDGVDTELLTKFFRKSDTSISPKIDAEYRRRTRDEDISNGLN